MKQIAILGAGESGIGAAILAKKMGYKTFLSDNKAISLERKIILNKHEIEYEETKHSENILLQADEIIKSPGIPDTTPVIRLLKKKSLPIISEIEFAGRFTKAKKICITGSNGKTTTTLLTYHILKKAKLNVGLAGNIGKSFARQVAENNFDYYVLELSNFQLEGTYNFKPEIAILLNITEDHLDRYDNFQQYIDAKFRITKNQNEEDVFIYCFDDELINNELNKKHLKAQMLPFSIEKKLKEGAFTKNNIINIITNQTKFKMNINQLSLQGSHNVYNSMAAAMAARHLNIRKGVIRDSLSDFENIEHRMEFVININGVDFVNDSKATNVDAAWYALETQDRPIIWIVGGQDKGNDYTILKDLVKKKVKAIVCMGKDNKKLHKEFNPIIRTIVDTDSAESAVKTAYKLAVKGDVVLLSPACASFDLFKNFEDRGNQFKKAIKLL